MGLRKWAIIAVMKPVISDPNLEVRAIIWGGSMNRGPKTSPNIL